MPPAWAWNAVNLRVIPERTMDNSAYTKRADSNGRHANVPVHFDDAAIERPDAAGANRQALERVRELIASGQMNASGRLPAERTLADNLGISRRALRHALDVLEAEGRITRQQ